MELSSISIAITSLVGALFSPGAIFTAGVNGAWYDPSDINLTWRRNLLTYSEQFDNAAWTRAATSVTPNSAVAPDGTLTADTLTATSASGYVFPTSGIFANAAGATFTYSVYVKENTSTTYTLLCTSAVNYTATYNLSTGVASGVSANAQASITPVGGGWFRLTLTLNSVPSQAYTEFQNGRLANGTSVYIWGAQLELGSTATPYQRITDGIKDYLDYKPLPILYQDAAGTTPVTAVGQPVGRILDKSGKGNHAFNPSGNSANFPVLSARYNLLTKTEDFSDAVWTKSNATVTANAAIAPDGTLTAYKLIATTATNDHGVIQGTTAGGLFVLSIYAKPAEYSKVQFFDGGFARIKATFDLSSVTASGDIGCSASITPLADGWFRCVAVSTNTFLNTYRVQGLPSSGIIASNYGDQYTGDGTSGIYVWHPDLRVTNDALNQPAYQRVNTSSDYDTEGFKPYLAFNGVNQWLQTNSIDFTYGDKMFVSAGVRKLSDAGTSVVGEFGYGSNGYFVMFAPDSPHQYNVNSKGTVNAAAAVDSGYAAPITNVISGIGNISGDQVILRANGAQAAISTSDQGTGNFGNYPLYIGARAGSSLWFNGRLYGLVVAGKQASASEIASTESWLNQKTGAY